MRTWKMADIRTVLKNSLLAIVKGEFLLRLNIGRYFVHIIYAFLLFAAAIWMSLMIEDTMAEVEKNKEEISELEITNSQLVFDLARSERRSEVETRLGELGSEVREPEKPATVIGR